MPNRVELLSEFVDIYKIRETVPGCSENQVEFFTIENRALATAGLGIRSFEKMFRSSVLLKRTFRSCCSFPFFWKERNALAVLLCSF